jgi:CBS domain-containing protein
MTRVQEAMTKNPATLSRSATVAEAAQCMAERDIGTVLVEDVSGLVGLVTDRDIVLRAVARGRDPEGTPLTEICSEPLMTVGPDDDVDRVVEIMREKAVRRVPVVNAKKQAIGILSLGDLARDRDPRSALGQISSAPPNR